MHDSRNSEVNLKQNCTIRQVKNVKYLGVPYDEFLTWRPHITNLSVSVSRALGRLQKCFHHRIGMRRTTPILLFEALVGRGGEVS